MKTSLGNAWGWNLQLPIDWTVAFTSGKQNLEQTKSRKQEISEDQQE